MADRDCENCKHYQWATDHIVEGCSVWQCKFEPKESADENTKETADGKSETGDMCNASL